MTILPYYLAHPDDKFKKVADGTIEVYYTDYKACKKVEDT
jgi:hypothetical protein